MSARAKSTLTRKPVGVRLAGAGMSVPDRVLTNADLEKMVDTSDEWIVQRTGIRERRIVSDGQDVRSLCGEALSAALENAGLAPDSLDMLILATLTPEMCTPSTSARVVADVGAGNAAAVDISAACSGFVYGLNMADALIRTGQYKRIAVAGAETLSKLTNWDDRGTCILFGDGAGAAVLEVSDDPDQGSLHQIMGSDGSMWTELYCPVRESDIPEGDEIFNGQLSTLQMNGREIYKFAVSKLQKCIDDSLQATGATIDDLAMIIAHQSNARILEGARKRAGLPEEKLYVNIDRYGNTSAASIPLALSELWHGGKVRPGDLVLFVGLGGGLSWASSLWRV